MPTSTSEYSDSDSRVFVWSTERIRDEQKSRRNVYEMSTDFKEKQSMSLIGNPAAPEISLKAMIVAVPIVSVDNRISEKRFARNGPHVSHSTTLHASRLAFTLKLMTSYPSKQEGPGRLNMAVDLGSQSWYANEDPLSKRPSYSSWEHIDAFRRSG
ncbi:hypothetical protein DMN91_001931 [Ooceraea biroi]|uniref:Uncharacterized protein n=1 Tax=Ooceraea biroi TaxID=2015173 RepID=A0A3L8DZP3_OOCBI|nr:hypothetical protein DMN91_001931 [Ooceraea biroi]